MVDALATANASALAAERESRRAHSQLEAIATAWTTARAALASARNDTVKAANGGAAVAARGVTATKRAEAFDFIACTP